jgi:crossover junction endodeoxyribonuclease RusA
MSTTPSGVRKMSVPPEARRSFRITLPIPPSANHCHVRRTKCYFKNGKKRRRVMNVLSPVASQWMADAKDAALTVMRETKWVPLEEKTVVEFWVFWPDKRRRDVHNLYKLLCDSLEGTVSPDDKWFLVRTMDFEVDKLHPRVEVVAYSYEPSCEQ